MSFFSQVLKSMLDYLKYTLPLLIAASFSGSVFADRHAIRADNLPVMARPGLLFKDGFKIALRASSNGKYVSVHRDGFRLDVTVRQPEEWGAFRVQDLNGTWFALIAGNNKYVRAGVGRTGQVAASSTRRDLWESFYYRVTHDGKIVLFDGKNRPLTVKNGWLTATTDMHDYETFSFIQLGP